MVVGIIEYQLEPAGSRIESVNAVCVPLASGSPGHEYPAVRER
jgi:hypothetical protein